MTGAVPARYQLGVGIVRLGLGVVVAVVALTCVAEVALRLVAPRPVRAFSDVRLDDAVCHPQREYALRPAATIDYAGVRTGLNAWGLRGSLPEAAARTAVLAVGDELTFGWGVPDAETFPAELGSLIHQRCASCGQVVNAGIPGYTSYQGLMLLRELVVRLRPRVVVLAFHANDALLGESPDSTGTCRDAGGIVPVLRRHSAVYAWLRWLLDRPPQGWWASQARTPIARYKRALLAMASESGRMGATPVFLNVGFGPEPPGEGGATGHRHRRGRFEGDYQASMRDAAHESVAPLVEFIGADLDRVTMLDDVHPTAEGYRQMAQRVARTMADSHLIP